VYLIQSFIDISSQLLWLVLDMQPD